MLEKEIRLGLTYDDVVLVPAKSQVLPTEVDTRTRLSRNIHLNIPIVSAAMDTVTEARLAIAIAQEGGIGIVHKNLTPAEQAAQVAKVKRYESGLLRDPVVITPTTSVREVMALSEQLGVSGFPVCDGGKVVGIVTGRDLRFETRYDQPVREIMTPRERLVTVPDGTTPEEAKALLNKHKLERLLVVNDAFELKGLITVKDITKQLNFPNAARDASGRLRVGAAVGVGEGTEERVEALVKAGVARVVAAMEDPNPLVAGRGLALLRDAGIDVVSGVKEAEARELNIGFVSRMIRGRPWLRLKAAATLDGKTALDNGVSQWITGDDARRDAHRWRARSCAVLTGIGTVRDDDPQLTVRAVPTERQPLRVVVDARLETPLNARLLDGGPVLVAAAIHDTAAAAAASWVTSIAMPARLSAASAEPALKPIQPTHSNAAPARVRARL